jgi:hypothetical protein
MRREPVRIAPERAIWGGKTTILTAAGASEKPVGDSTGFAPLVGTSAENFTMNEIPADRAYLPHDNLARMKQRARPLRRRISLQKRFLRGRITPVPEGCGRSSPFRGPDDVSAPQKVLDLVEVFDRNAAAYESPYFKEAELRQQFINPLFKQLGWDMDNEAGNAEVYKDVVHEAAVKVGGATKAPDYSFRIGGTPKFYLEAKKPAVNVKDDPAPAYQLRRYAWTARMPLSILTNFKEFAVYDGRVKPDPTHKAAIARVLYLRCGEYAGAWDEKIAAVFSRDAILKGYFDKFADSNKAKRGTAAVDDAFLDEIEKWREQLARNLALRNPELSSRELNFAVQITIDRIIFLRLCEDRGIETYGQLQALQNGAAVYGRLKEVFQRADDRYNSGLFHFRKEKDRAEAPDELTPGLHIDDAVLKSILHALYPPACPYEFSVLPVEILGHVYEQFLGKVIRLTASHQAKVEEKPEVKKAGGVYYTPSYIVDYIVRNTVGRLLESKTPKEAAKLTVLDPACGSGSFLVGAYRHLLEWHRKQYEDDGPEKHKKELFQAAGGGWRLTTAEKKRILLNNIYGVDIDPQAVEVTKLSLLLVVLEGESQETLETQRRLFHERALPDLAGNVQCGNSLIGPDFYEGETATRLDAEERYRINVFDWDAAFPKIMKAGGFDAVIGNPPYVRIQTLNEWAALEVEFYKKAYESAGQGNYDLYVVFVEKGLGRLNKDGRLGFILPHKFFNAQYGQSLRGLLARGNNLAEVVHFGHQQVFAVATTYTCLLFLKRGTDKCRFIKVDDLAAWRATSKATEGWVTADRITATVWNFAIGPEAKLFERLRRIPAVLGDVAARMAQGIRTSANEVYVLDLVAEDKDSLTAYSKQLQINIELERGAVSLFLQGREIKRYRIMPSGKAVIIPYRTLESGIELIPETEFREILPRAFNYLLSNKRYLESRENGRMRGAGWYGYVYPKNIDVMASRKILVPDIADAAAFALDEEGGYAFTSGYAIILKASVAESPKYILGLLNSRVLDFFLKKVSTPLRGGFFRYFTQFIEQLPIARIDFTSPADKSRHDRMVQLVEGMLSLHQQLAAAKAPHDKTILQTQIDATDRQVDRLVYDLYGLTEEEIRIVEGEPPYRSGEKRP